MTSLTLTAQAARRALEGVIPPGLDDEATLERFARAVWSSLAEPGDAVAGALVAALGAVGALRGLTGEHLLPAPSGIEGLDAGLSRWMPRLAAEPVEASLASARRSGVRLVTPGDAEWPEGLDDLGVHAPLALWARGDAQVLCRRPSTVAIVGARASTAYGDQVAVELAGELAADGVLIVSGGAYGIDGAAHRAALGSGGSTVAFLAGGVDRPYPSGNTHLLERVAGHGALVAELPCGAAPTKWRFLQRNRLIAAFAQATVVVEAGWRSGSLNTAGHAAQLSRGLGAVPGPITSATSAGTHRLLREYGAACITGAADVRELLGVRVGAPEAADPGERTADPERGRTDDATRVRDALSVRTPRSVEELARRSGMSYDGVSAVLGLLALDGSARRRPEGWMRAPSSPTR
ncbi:DNA-processing protein DprA [Microbacterium hominis]|uniref:DNA-protecting protein DprA n=1 Tax=Microbacterium hominis TaxID=162426 RepID=A0A7D4PM53_9MICO|nr:DNA-processing protein DprA [Microbacterium hominis]QKJ19290.1 DNA-protecting protein DprA [Microbacterium hominis]